MGDFQFSYGSKETVSVQDTGHGTMQVNFKPGNRVKIGDMELELLQYHFHTPSEHAFDGARTTMEVHLVHKVVGTGGVAVIGVMINNGAIFPNPAMQTALVYAPSATNELFLAPITVDPNTLLPSETRPGHRPYVHYSGSLTTPPCSEGVEWFVMTTPIKVSDRQVIEFMQYVGHGDTLGLNSRPVQPLNFRTEEYYL